MSPSNKPRHFKYMTHRRSACHCTSISPEGTVTPYCCTYLTYIHIHTYIQSSHMSDITLSHVRSHGNGQLVAKSSSHFWAIFHTMCTNSWYQYFHILKGSSRKLLHEREQRRELTASSADMHAACVNMQRFSRPAPQYKGLGIGSISVGVD